MGGGGCQGGWALVEGGRGGVPEEGWGLHSRLPWEKRLDRGFPARPQGLCISRGQFVWAGAGQQAGRGGQAGSPEEAEFTTGVLRYDVAEASTFSVTCRVALRFWIQTWTSGR